MKAISTIAVLILCVGFAGCNAVSEYSRDPIRREVARITKDEKLGAKFEARLQQLGATFEPGATRGEKRALVPIRHSTDYMPPRAIVIDYQLEADGTVSRVRSDVVSFAAR